MFSNRFNTRNDPLLEAAQAAMKDGETRRQAEAFVNEQFGVYSRKAVVREELAAYDAALEEAYGALKEGKSLDPVGREDKDIDNDGDHDKSDKYLLNRRKTIGRAMGKKMEEGTAEAETSMSVTKDNKPSTPAQTNASTSGPSASDKAALASKIKTMREEQIDELYGKGKLKGIIAARQEKEDQAKREYNAAERKMMDARSETGKAEKVKEKLRLRNISKPGDPHYNWAHSKKKLREEEQIDEAAYSAKAARAGKDIGKPGKQFSKIAKSAGKRYGSEERGKKVAGAILARIRAKHMKEENLEELSAFGSAFAAARKAGQSNFSFGGKSFNTKMASSTPKSSTGVASTTTPTKWKSPSAPDQAATIKASGGTPSAETGTAKPVPTINAPTTPVKKFTPSPAQQQAASDAKNVRAGGGAPQGPTTTGVTGAKFAGTDAVSAPKGSAADVYGSRSVGGPQSSIPSGPSGERSVGKANITAPAPATPKIVDKPLMKESVQIGENKYRII